VIGNCGNRLGDLIYGRINSDMFQKAGGCVDFINVANFRSCGGLL